jgi:putative flavoprotein involved in K+ transport
LEGIEEGIMERTSHIERVHTVVIGGGQAGLSTGYHLARRNVPFVILDASQRVGDVWRARWDSLRLFTPAMLSSLDGMPFPAEPYHFPTATQMADYLEAYAQRFALPVRTGMRVDRLSRVGDRFLVCAGERQFEAENVVVAMANFQRPRVPPFAADLNRTIVQLHSYEYRNPSQLAAGDVLVIGAGNSGAEIALELSRSHRVWLSGRETGHIPFNIEGLAARLILARLTLRVMFHRVLTIATPVGRRVRSKVLHGGGPLIRTRPGDLARAGVHQVPRVSGVQNGLPILEDGRVLDVANVVWCTGFHPGFSWIDLPVFGPDGEPLHEAGIVKSQPGLYFVGLHFLYSLSSVMIHGVGRDASRIAGAVAARARLSGQAASRLHAA